MLNSHEELVRGASLRGSPDVFTLACAERLGRALGTQLLRHGQVQPGGAVIVGRGEEAAARVARDGLACGLVACGLVVHDLGVTTSDAITAALRQLRAGGGVLVGVASGSLGLMCFVGARPLVGEGLKELAAIADAGVFASGAGRFVSSVASAPGVLLFPEAALAAAEPDKEQGEGDGSSAIAAAWGAASDESQA
jgi:hypothetical protein